MNVKELRNSVDSILSFGFNLGYLKCTPITSDAVNFAKDYQKDLYNIFKIIEKNIDDKNILAHSKITHNS
jgi:hypothetical protein